MIWKHTKRSKTNKNHTKNYNIIFWVDGARRGPHRKGPEFAFKPVSASATAYFGLELIWPERRKIKEVPYMYVLMIYIPGKQAFC